MGTLPTAGVVPPSWFMSQLPHILPHLEALLLYQCDCFPDAYQLLEKCSSLRTLELALAQAWFVVASLLLLGALDVNTIFFIWR